MALVSYLTVDATGVGMPVVESLRAAKLGCRGMTAVTITPGARARQASGFGVGEQLARSANGLAGGVTDAAGTGRVEDVEEDARVGDAGAGVVEHA